MANFQTQGQPSPRALYEQKYRTSRMNLLLVVAFTAINLILLITNANSYFLFSAFVPYFIAGLGMMICGRFPEEYYEGMEELTFFDNSVFAVLLIIAFALTLLYLLAWFMSSKNRSGWLIFALVFFAIDTIAMIFIDGISLAGILDVAFHGWVIYYLVIGISAAKKLKELPPEEELTPEAATENGDATITAEGTEGPQNSTPLRDADKEAKHRVLAEAYALNKYDVCYRRVKQTNELVINGKVYDQLQAAIEYPHMLVATVDGHRISAGYTGTHSVIIVDGETVTKKIRLI